MVAVVVDSRVDTWDKGYMAMVDMDCRKAFAGQQLWKAWILLLFPL